jgi:hypothetical protein
LQSLNKNSSDFQQVFFILTYIRRGLKWRLSEKAMMPARETHAAGFEVLNLCACGGELIFRAAQL